MHIKADDINCIQVNVNVNAYILYVSVSCFLEWYVRCVGLFVEVYKWGR